MTELALSTPLSGEQRELLTTVQDSAYSLLGLINDILDISKVEAGKLDLAAIEVDLEEVLATTMKTLACRAGQKGLGMEWSLAPDVPKQVVGDPHRLRQVLINLAGNAVKFTDQGRITLSVHREPGSSELHFVVSDTGVGIPKDKHQLIFEPFLQLDASNTRRHGGTGLGLAICKRFIERMGGRIWVESQLGYGSQFHFTIRLLPCVPAPPAGGGMAGLAGRSGRHGGLGGTAALQKAVCPSGGGQCSEPEGGASHPGEAGAPSRAGGNRGGGGCRHSKGKRSMPS